MLVVYHVWKEEEKQTTCSIALHSFVTLRMSFWYTLHTGDRYVEVFVEICNLHTTCVRYENGQRWLLLIIPKLMEVSLVIEKLYLGKRRKLSSNQVGFRKSKPALDNYNKMESAYRLSLSSLICHYGLKNTCTELGFHQAQIVDCGMRKSTEDSLGTCAQPRTQPLRVYKLLSKNI